MFFSALIANRLINHCERFYGLGSKHKILNDMRFLVPIDVDDKQVQFDVLTEFFIGSNKPISGFEPNAESNQFPSILPLESTISLRELHYDTNLQFTYRKLFN